MGSDNISVADVNAFLRREQALIVHFSGVPPCTSYSGAKPYPLDLQHVIAGGARSGVCCSVVRATDKFVGGGDCHAIGNIGVILGLTSMKSLLAVTVGDGGSWVNPEGKREFIDRPIGMSDIEASVRDRSGHNEWIVGDYSVLGILAVAPFQYWGDVDLGGGETTGGPLRTSFMDVRAQFASIPVLTFFEGKIIRSCEVDELYP